MLGKPAWVLNSRTLGYSPRHGVFKVRYIPGLCRWVWKANMQTETPQQFPPLEDVDRPTVDTASAAYYLNRRPQTLRGWACLENGPLRPIRINGRLAWPVASIRQLLGVS